MRQWFVDIFHILFRSEVFKALITPAEAERLQHYASRVDGVAVEIGTFNGGSTSLISRALPKSARLVSIDPYVADSMIPSLRGSLVHAYLNVLRHGNISRVEFKRGYSHDVVKHWSDPVNFLWLDGSHLYEDVRRDFELWSPFVPPNGLILFHDANQKHESDDVYEGGWCGPTQVCREIVERQGDRFECIETVDSLRVFRKN